MNKIDILLSTYNGEKYLTKLLESLLDQTVKDFRLVVRDDKSTDNTFRILNDFKTRFDDMIILSSEENLGPARSFSVLIENSKADYIFFCDQDDIWISTKIEKQIKTIRKAEDKYDRSLPILCHSDLFITDEYLDIISPSYYMHIGHSPKRNRPYQLALQNSVVGCSVAFNKALLEKALPIPEDIVMHDWWLALVASLTGKIIFDPNPLMLYRQHDLNTVGAKRTQNYFKRLSKLLPRADNKNFTNYMNKVLIQAEEAFKRYQFDTSVEKADKLDKLLLLKDLTFFPRAVHILSEGFFRHTLLESLELILRYKP